MDPAFSVGAGSSERESITPARSKSSPYLERLDLNRAAHARCAVAQAGALRGALDALTSARSTRSGTYARAGDHSKDASGVRRTTCKTLPPGAIDGSHLASSVEDVAAGSREKPRPRLTRDSKQRLRGAARETGGLSRAALARTSGVCRFESTESVCRRAAPGRKAPPRAPHSESGARAKVTAPTFCVSTRATGLASSARPE